MDGPVYIESCLKDILKSKNISYTYGTARTLGHVDYSKFYKPQFTVDKYTPKKIIYNNPATIVFWADGTKTVVKKSKGEKYNAYNAFCAALAKKIYGNNTRVNKFVNSGIDQKAKEKEKQK